LLPMSSPTIYLRDFYNNDDKNDQNDHPSIIKLFIDNNAYEPDDTLATLLGDLDIPIQVPKQTCTIKKILNVTNTSDKTSMQNLLLTADVSSLMPIFDKLASRNIITTVLELNPLPECPIKSSTPIINHTLPIDTIQRLIEHSYRILSKNIFTYRQHNKTILDSEVKNGLPVTHLIFENLGPTDDVDNLLHPKHIMAQSHK